MTSWLGPLLNTMGIYISHLNENQICGALSALRSTTMTEPCSKKKKKNFSFGTIYNLIVLDYMANSGQWRCNPPTICDMTTFQSHHQFCYVQEILMLTEKKEKKKGRP